MRTPGIKPTAAVDLNGDGTDEVIFNNEAAAAFQVGTNFTYDPVTRQFALLNVTTDVPLAAGQVDGDASQEIIYGDVGSGNYRLLDVDSDSFSDLFLDPEQVVPGFVAIGILTGDDTGMVLFQEPASGQTVVYDRNVGNFTDVLATTVNFLGVA